MTEVEAVQLLDRVVAQVPGTRADHQKILEAIEVLSKLVGDLNNPKPKKAE